MIIQKYEVNQYHLLSACVDKKSKGMLQTGGFATEGGPANEGRFANEGGKPH